MNTRYIDILFFFMCSTLIFNCIPTWLQANFLAGPMGLQLSFYPAIIGMFYTIYCQVKNKSYLPYLMEFKSFLFIYALITMVSLIHGLHIYPYYDCILSGPVEQIDKIPKLLEFLQEYNINVTAKELLSFWMIARPIKSLVFELIYTFGIAYMIYIWYSSDWKRGFSVLLKAILGSCILMMSYSIIEVYFLAGNLDAKNILEKINPYIHLIKNNGTWHPPLLWYGQLRSIFAEPSHFGIYAAFVMPFIWYMLISRMNSKKMLFLYSAMVVLMTFFIILTKARTAFLLLVGEILISIFVFCVLQNKYYIKKYFIVFLCSLIAFLSGNYFIEYNIVHKNNTSITATNTKKTNNVSFDVCKSIVNYVESNAVSVVNSDKRSNRARYSVMNADFRIGMDNLWLGVGTGLRSAYIPDYFDEKALRNSEVKMWLHFREKLGIMKFGIARLGEYTARFAETGVIGLLFWIMPAVILLYQLYKKICFINDVDKLKYIVFSVSLIGVLVSGIGDFINLFYSYWVLLGLGYAMCFSKSDEKLNNE